MRRVVFALIALALSWSLPSILHAQELPEGNWSGSQTNPNNGNTQAIFLEVKKIADPHWRWRASTEELLSATLTGGQLQVLVTDIQLDAEKLSYSYTARQGGLVNCNLTLQQGSSYAGECVRQDGGGRRLVTLTPPTDPG